MRIPVSAALCAIVIAAACSKAPAYWVSEVGQDGDSSSVFLAMDPVRAWAMAN